MYQETKLQKYVIRVKRLEQMKSIDNVIEGCNKY